jgi:hypothetical protein
MRRTSSGSRDTFSPLLPISDRQWARRLLLREKEWLLSESQSPDATYLRTAIVASMYAPRVGYDARFLFLAVRGVGVEPTLSGSQGRRIPTFLPPGRVDRRGIAPRFPPCDGGVFLLDEQP